MHFSIDRTVHTTAFDKPVVDHWLERKIAQTAAGSTEKDRSDDRPLQRQARYRLSYIPLHITDKVRFMSITNKVRYIRITDKVRYTRNTDFVYNGQNTLVPTGTLYARFTVLLGPAPLQIKPNSAI